MQMARYVLVDWGSDCAPTWEPVTNLENAGLVALREFDRRRRQSAIRSGDLLRNSRRTPTTRPPSRRPPITVTPPIFSRQSSRSRSPTATRDEFLASPVPPENFEDSEYVPSSTSSTESASETELEAEEDLAQGTQPSTAD